MSDKTKPQDSAAMPPASAGSQDAEKFKRAYKAMYRVAEVHISQIAELRAELLQARMQPTLTDEEREAVKRSVFVVERWRENGGYHTSLEEDIATLLKLLERTK